MPRSKDSSVKQEDGDTVTATSHNNDDDDVEAFRSAKRQQDRDSREEGETDAKADYEKERQLRMQRLRQELQEEDQEMQEKLEPTAAALPKEENPQETIVEVKEEELEGLNEEEQMRKLMGIDGFGSTKGEKVEDNFSTSARGVVQKNKARKYRQYMNRKNGFNRPLEKMN